MMDAANAAVPRVTPVQAREMMTNANTLVVDVRDAPEVEKSGSVAGSVNVSRGMLEFGPILNRLTMTRAFPRTRQSSSTVLRVDVRLWRARC